MIQLHVDLFVDPNRESELKENYQRIFAPAIREQPGFLDVQLLVREGSGPWRLVVVFETEEQRQAWVATDAHSRAWPAIEETLTGDRYAVALFAPVR